MKHESSALTTLIEHSIEGKKVTIPCLVIDNTLSSTRHILTQLKSGALVHLTASAGASAGESGSESGSSACDHVSSCFSFDENPLDEVLLTSGRLREPSLIVFQVMALYSLWLTFLAIKLVFKMVAANTSAGDNRNAKNRFKMRMLILIPEIVAGLVRAAACLDVTGMYQVQSLALSLLSSLIHLKLKNYASLTYFTYF